MIKNCSKKFFGRKSFVLTLCFSFLATAVFQIAPASAEESKVLYETKEITNAKELWERAKNGISDVNKEEISVHGTLTNQMNGKKEHVDTISTTQLLKVVRNSDGKNEKVYSTTSFAKVLGGNSSGAWDWDSSYGVKASSMIYWTNSSKNGRSYVDLTRSTGNWYREDTSISITSKTVKVHASGYNTSGKWSDVTKTYYPGYSFNYASNLPTVGGTFFIGCNMYTKLKRGSSTYSLNLYNSHRY